jgi:hypothetical protein
MQLDEPGEFEMRASHPLIGVVLLVTSAHAQDTTPRPADPPAADAPPAEATDAPPQQWSVSAGLGVTDFTGRNAGDATDIGITYDVRVGYRLTPGLRVEGALFRSTQAIAALGLEADADIVGTGLEGVVRYDFLSVAAFDLGGVQMSPFVFGGLGYQKFSLSDEGANTSDIAASDNTLVLPVGAGIGGTRGALQLDARFTWRQTFDDQMFSARVGGDIDSSLDQWSLTARAGLAF